MFPAQKAIGFYQRPIPARSSANQFVIPLVEMAGNALAPTPALALKILQGCHATTGSAWIVHQQSLAANLKEGSCMRFEL